MFNFWNNFNANQANSQAIPISKYTFEKGITKDVPKKPDGYKSINSSSIYIKGVCGVPPQAIAIGNFNTCQSSQKQFYHSSSHY